MDKAKLNSPNPWTDGVTPGLTGHERHSLDMRGGVSTAGSTKYQSDRNRNNNLTALGKRPGGGQHFWPSLSKWANQFPPPSVQQAGHSDVGGVTLCLKPAGSGGAVSSLSMRSKLKNVTLGV